MKFIINSLPIFLLTLQVLVSSDSYSQSDTDGSDWESKSWNVWNGNESTNWNDPLNWSDGVPDSSTRTRIPSQPNNQPVITSPANCGELSITNGAILTIASSALILSGPMKNLGTVNAGNGTITLFGQGDMTLKGSDITVNRLVVNKGSEEDTVIIDLNISISDEMLFINGIVLINNGELVFLDGAESRDGSPNCYIDGRVKKIGNNEFTFPIGNQGVYAPVSIETFGPDTEAFSAQYFNRNPDDLGYNILSFENSLTNISSCEYWIIDHDMGTDPAQITLSYEDARSCGTPEPWNLNVVRWTGTTWENLGSSGFEGDTQSGIIKSLDAISEFSPFTLGSSSLNNPLPVELLNFDVTPHNNQVKIEWSTATETNSDYFEVERSRDLAEFTSIGIVDGAGNSTTALHYELYDDSFLSGTWYYRLKQFDIDGQLKIYPPKSIFISQGISLRLFPNPVLDHVNILQAGFGDRVDIKIYSSAGVLLKYLVSDQSEIELSIEELSSGIYILEVSGVNGLQREQLIKN